MELVGEATDGLEAIDICNHTQPDIILMDLIMPQMDGITATRIIKQTFPDIKIIILTGQGDNELVSMALKSGALRYLRKGLSAADLDRAILEA
jgi:YesN/AraC family two-component response regulator